MRAALIPPLYDSYAVGQAVTAQFTIHPRTELTCSGSSQRVVLLSFRRQPAACASRGCFAL